MRMMRLPERLADMLLLGGLATAAVSCGVAVIAAWRWPLVGDAALMHYVVFLLHAGMAPYRQIVDINLPGSYALEAVAMRVFGAGALGLRLYDGALCGLICGCAVVLSGTGWRRRVCGALAGLLFVLIHLQDGVVQAGQRDLAMAALSLAALALLLRVEGSARIVGFELLVGLTLVIKPTLILLALLPFCAAWVRRERLPLRETAAGIAALALAPAGALLWLWRWHSIGGFRTMLSGIERTHAGLARTSVSFLLLHSMAPVALLIVMGVATWVLLRFAADAELKVLGLAAACGLVSYLLQHKGFSYQRYSFLLLALVCVFRMAASGLEARGWSRGFATALIGLTCFWFVPRFAWKVRTFEHVAPFEDALGADLIMRRAGDGEVQCLDTFGGCIATLNRLHIRQSTGYLYDCYAYAGTDADRETYRRGFLPAILEARPRVIVLSSQYCLGFADGMTRVARWPEMDSLLSKDYSIDGGWEPRRAVHLWSRSEMPPSYRIYVRRSKEHPGSR